MIKKAGTPECDHILRVGPIRHSAFLRYPPMIGKFRTCLRCGATKIGRGTSTFTDSYWEHVVAAAPANPAAGSVRVYTPSGTSVTVRDSAGTTSDLSAAGSGEANTASNIGTAGTGVFKDKVGVDLRFKKINAGSAKATITDDTVNNEVDIDVVDATITQKGAVQLAGDLGGTSASPTVANDAITNAKLADMAANTVKARVAATSGDPSDLAVGANTVVGRAGADIVAAQVVTAQVADDAIAYAKMQNVSATDKVLGRSSVGAGDPEEISCTAAGRALIDDADAAAQRTTLGLGALATKATVATADIDNDAVTYAKIQNVSTTSRVLGRNTAGAGDVEEVTPTQLTAMLDTFTSALKGLAPSSGGGTSNFLRADGTWATPGGSGALTRAGGNTTEATTTSTTVVDLLSSTVSIGNTLPIVVFCNWRKTTGAAAFVRLGIQFNDTDMQGQQNVDDASNAVRGGGLEYWSYLRDATYARTANGRSWDTYSGTRVNWGQESSSPTGTITDIDIIGSTADAAQTLGVDDVQIYSYSAS